VEAQKQHVEFLEAEKNKRTTRPPFNGYIVEEHTNVGQWLSKGDPIVTLAKLDEVEVEVQVDQSYVDQIASGQNVTLSIAGSGSRDGRASVWPGVVSAVVPRSRWQQGSRSFPVIIRIDNKFDDSTSPPMPFLREGMMAEAVFKGNGVSALMVPKVSLLPTQDDPRIFIVNPPVEGQPLKSVRQVTVKPGLSDGTWIQVTGDDLEPGMLVVTEGVERLRPSKTIEILETEETSREQ
jgi:RND family efflux transporter MFP subunit